MMKDKASFDLNDIDSLNRITKYFESLYNIMELKNKDSEESSDGGAVCYYEIIITVEEKWV